MSHLDARERPSCDGQPIWIPNISCFGLLLIIRTSKIIMSASVSSHFVAEKVKALCVVSDGRLFASKTLEKAHQVLPIVAVGGWDNKVRRYKICQTYSEMAGY